MASAFLVSMHYSSSTDNSIDRKAALGLEIETKGSQLSKYVDQSYTSQVQLKI